MCTRINVPLFFMISGALLLGKEETYEVVLKKRVPRICLDILIFEGILYVGKYFKSILLGRVCEFSIKTFVLEMLSGNIDGAGSYLSVNSFSFCVFFFHTFG